MPPACPGSRQDDGPALRVLPTLAGGVLGLALGSLILSGILCGRAEPDGLELLAFAAALGVFVAAAMFAANEGWRGQSLLAGLARCSACVWRWRSPCCCCCPA